MSFMACRAWSSPSLTSNERMLSARLFQACESRTELATDSEMFTPTVQDDVLPGTSTVWECMLFHHSLRVPPCSRQAQRRRVAEVLEDLGLLHVAHSLIGDAFTRGLSGGEKRRVSIGIELLTEPALLFLDEPTTGALSRYCICHGHDPHTAFPISLYISILL